MATNAAHNQQAREAEKILLTREGYDEKKARLQWLKDVRRREVADYIHEAKEAGDVSESSAYEDAKNLQAMVEGEIQELQHLIDHAEILDISTVGENGQRTIRLGVTFEVETDRGSKRRFQLVSSAEAGQGKLSDQSPVGRALLGHLEGDHVEVQTPGGAVVYTITSIR